MTLVLTDNWPTTISNIPVKIMKPKVVPDCFALVVRYVPRELDLEFVKDEIKRTIASADNIKQIYYAYERRSNEFRFTVMDLAEYNTARELGLISIGNHWLSIIPFLSGNRMTYCTRCWKIGHMRQQCKSNIQCCRLCLQGITNREEHKCSNMPKCAQCDGEHHSLNSQYHVIQQYRADLKEGVTKALEAGKLHRNEFMNPQSDVNMRNEEWPHLGEPKKHQHIAWNHVQTENHNEGTPDTTKVLLLINENLTAMRESNKRVEEKLEKMNIQLNQTALDAELHQGTLNKLIECLQAVVQNVLRSVTHKVHPDLVMSKSGVQPIFDVLCELKSNLNSNYEVRRKRPTTPPTPTTQSDPNGKMISDDSVHTKQS